MLGETSSAVFARRYRDGLTGGLGSVRQVRVAGVWAGVLGGHGGSAQG